MSTHHRHHHHGHHHHHHHDDDHASVKNIGFAFALNFVFTIVEFIGGFYTGSMAILSDALHDLGDTIALGMAMVIERVAKKSATPAFSYGFRRLSLVSAGVTGLLLVTGSVVIVMHAIPRLKDPQQPQVGGMLVLAVVGVLVNGLAALRVSKGKTLNERTVSWHMMEDVLGWVVILIGSIVMSIWDVPIIDPILSIVFAFFILFGVSRNLKQVFDLFLQAVPKSIPLQAMRSKIEALTHVQNLHDIHVWSLDGDSHVMTMHAVVSDALSVQEVRAVKEMIRSVVREFGNIHLTLEIEHVTDECPNYNCGYLKP